MTKQNVTWKKQWSTSNLLLWLFYWLQIRPKNTESIFHGCCPIVNTPTLLRWAKTTKDTTGSNLALDFFLRFKVWKCCEVVPSRCVSSAAWYLGLFLSSARLLLHSWVHRAIPRETGERICCLQSLCEAFTYSSRVEETATEKKQALSWTVAAGRTPTWNFLILSDKEFH